MTGSVDPAGALLLAHLERIHGGLERVQREISSGLRVSAASDAPDEVAGILALRAALERNSQLRTNLERARSEADTADAVLQRAVQVLERAAVLAVEGAGSLAAGNRKAIAVEVRGLQEELVALSRSTSEGRFLFSGDEDQAPAYELDLGGDAGVKRLLAPAATRKVEHPSGVVFTVSRTAGEIFDERLPDGSPSPRNAFAAVNSLRAALEADDGAGTAPALESLRAAAAHINGALGFYGAVQNRIRGALEEAGKLGVRLERTLSERRDADLTASILELQQLQLNQSAALSARAYARRSSLFEYLK